MTGCFLKNSSLVHYVKCLFLREETETERKRERERERKSTGEGQREREGERASKAGSMLLARAWSGA